MSEASLILSGAISTALRPHQAHDVVVVVHARHRRATALAATRARHAGSHPARRTLALTTTWARAALTPAPTTTQLRALYPSILHDPTLAHALTPRPLHRLILDFLIVAVPFLVLLATATTSPHPRLAIAVLATTVYHLLAPYTLRLHRHPLATRARHHITR